MCFGNRITQKISINDQSLNLFAAIILNISGFILGYIASQLFRFDLLKKRALSIEIGMQNAGLGSVLALKHFSEKAALPAVIFVFICIFSASLLVPLWARSSRKKSTSAT